MYDKMTKEINKTSTSPIVEPLLAVFAMSSATKDVATLRRGILNSFDIELKMFIETPAEANSTEPMEKNKHIKK